MKTPGAAHPTADTAAQRGAQARTQRAGGHLIAVAGIDGAGKSTLTTALHAAFRDRGQEAILVSKNTTQAPMSPELSRYVESLHAVVYRRPASVGAACGDHYWLFALAAWYSLQDRLIIAPALQAGTHVILDNSHHKILARYASDRQMPADLAQQVFTHLTPPEIVVFLRLTPKEALHRKRHFSALETGHTGADPSAFLTHQASVTRELQHQADHDHGGQWAPIDVTGKDTGTVLAEALTVLSQRLGLPLA